MPFSEQVKRHAFGRDYARCIFPDCGMRLIYPVSDYETLDAADMAHIHSERINGPRYEKQLPLVVLRSAWNCMTLCHPHHRQVDDRRLWPTQYPAQLLHKWRQDSWDRYLWGSTFDAAVAQLDERQIV